MSATFRVNYLPYCNYKIILLEKRSNVKYWRLFCHSEFRVFGISPGGGEIVIPNYAQIALIFLFFRVNSRNLS